jgi:hypothetical protein
MRRVEFSEWRTLDNRATFAAASLIRLLCAGLLAVATAAAIPRRAAAQAWPILANSSSQPAWTLTSAARGGPAQSPLPAVVRVISPERNGASLGSGTLVDVSAKHGLILTNWHVVKDAAGNVIVSFPDGFQSPGYVLKMDRDWDLAAVAIWRPNVAPVPIATMPARPGDMLTIAGYGSGNFRAQSGPCTQYLSPGPGLPFEMVEVHAAARHGDSGGPILNTRGELAGVLFGEGGGETSGSYCGRVQVFLQSLGGVGSPALPQNSLASVPARQPSATVTAPLNISPPPLMNPLAPIAQANSARPGEEIALDSSSSAMTEPLPSRLPPIASISEYPSTGAAEIRPRLPQSSSGSSASAAGSAPAGDSVGAAAPRSATENLGAPGAAAASDHLTWEDLAGHTWGDQIKTILAGAGVLLLVLQVIRWVA